MCKPGFAKLTVDYSEDQRSQRIALSSSVYVATTYQGRRQLLRNGGALPLRGHRKQSADGQAQIDIGGETDSGAR